MYDVTKPLRLAAMAAGITAADVAVALGLSEDATRGMGNGVPVDSETLKSLEQMFGVLWRPTMVISAEPVQVAMELPEVKMSDVEPLPPFTRAATLPPSAYAACEDALDSLGYITVPIFLAVAGLSGGQTARAAASAMFEEMGLESSMLSRGGRSTAVYTRSGHRPPSDIIRPLPPKGRSKDGMSMLNTLLLTYKVSHIASVIQISESALNKIAKGKVQCRWVYDYAMRRSFPSHFAQPPKCY